ncbi:hypothetical protein ACPA54_32900 [Uniformispora flossi]|uniref:hypothetical protein n=1 Tax=Uniformispora flossi TaxID=3390723 RepID=UPI003C2D1CF4
MTNAAIASAVAVTPIRPTRRTSAMRPVAASVRTIDPESWRSSDVPLLRDPRALVTRLHELHGPTPGTAVVAVLDATGRPVASASFATDGDTGSVDGWQCRNTILATLRLIVPDDLRRPAPVRTTVLLLCRDGRRAWEPDDGRWMWGLRDACALHGLRGGAVVVLAEDGWEVVGDGRSGRTPASVPRVALLPVRRKPGKGKAKTEAKPKRRAATAQRPRPRVAPEPAERTVARVEPKIEPRTEPQIEPGTRRKSAGHDVPVESPVAAPGRGVGVPERTEVPAAAAAFGGHAEGTPGPGERDYAAPVRYLTDAGATGTGLRCS